MWKWITDHTKKMDLRNISHHSTFSCRPKEFEFGLIFEKENITTHSSENPKTVQHKHDEVKKVLLDGLETMKKKGVPYYAIIHFYTRCTGMDADFIFCDAGVK